MKTTYMCPTLITYGRLNALTLGTSGTLPDISLNGNVVTVVSADGCPTATGSDSTRIACVVTTAGS